MLLLSLAANWLGFPNATHLFFCLRANKKPAAMSDTVDTVILNFANILRYHISILLDLLSNTHYFDKFSDAVSS